MKTVKNGGQALLTMMGLIVFWVATMKLDVIQAEIDVIFALTTSFFPEPWGRIAGGITGMGFLLGMIFVPLEIMDKSLSKVKIRSDSRLWKVLSLFESDEERRERHGQEEKQSWTT